MLFRNLCILGDKNPSSCRSEAPSVASLGRKSVVSAQWGWHRGRGQRITVGDRRSVFSWWIFLKTKYFDLTRVRYLKWKNTHTKVYTCYMTCEPHTREESDFQRKIWTYPKQSLLKWLFQLDESKSVQLAVSPKIHWLFKVPGTSVFVRWYQKKVIKQKQTTSGKSLWTHTIW